MFKKAHNSTFNVVRHGSLVAGFLLCLLFVVNCGGPQCKENDDCLADQRCSAGTCISNTCKDEGDCIDGQVCLDSQCKPKPKEEPKKGECSQDSDCKAPTPKCDANQNKCVGCLSSIDCREDQNCTNNQCEDKVKPECARDADCRTKANPRCSTAGKCEWECTVDTDCSIKMKNGKCQNYRCVNQSECSQDSDCRGKSKPFCSTAGKCEWGCKTSSDCRDASCVDNQCAQNNAACTNVSDCAPGQTCWMGLCTQACNPQNDTCTNGQKCFDAMGPTSGFCLKGCNPQDRSSCHSGLLCARRTPNSPQNYCLPRVGPRQFGQSCSLNNQGLFCDAAQSLGCYITSSGPAGQSQGTCLKGCNPAKGQQNNPACGSGFCKPYPFNHWGGACIPQSTEPEGQSCVSGQSCPAGQTCSQLNKRCYRSCIDRNGCGSGTICQIDSCLNICDPTQGSFANPKCPLGTRCTASTRYRPGFCIPLIAPFQGTKQLGEACSTKPNETSMHCDANKNLFCQTIDGKSQCALGCDPRKGFASNSDCNGGSCSGTAVSHLGGVCSLLGTKKKGETCDNQQNGCEKGLVCLSGLCVTYCNPDDKQASTCGKEELCIATGQGSGCVQRCDPKLGHYPNPSCAKGTYCDFEDAAGAFCKSLPQAPTGTKQRSEKCDTTSNFCDSSKGLICGSWGNTCSIACDPSKGTLPNADCPTGYTCRVDPKRSNKGGACYRYRAMNRKKGETCLTGTDREKPEWNHCEKGLSCNGDTKICEPGETRLAACGLSIKKYCNSELACSGVKTQNRYFCRKPCMLNNPQCDPGFTCVPLNTQLGTGTCYQACQSSRDCTQGGKICGNLSKKRVCY